MTSRIHAAHTTCPSCREEVFLEELVKGRCPLCGCELGEFAENEGELDEYLERSDLPWLVFNYFLFKRFMEMGASPLRVMELASGYNDPDSGVSGSRPDTSFLLEVPRGRLDRVRPKRCAKCRRLFIAGGKKMVSGDLAVPGCTFVYHCPKC
jgi:hypothetical protein